ADFNLGGNASSTVSTTSVGTYNMTGGLLNLNKASAFTWGIGNGLNSTGIMNQTGGTVTVSNSGNNGIDIGRNNGGGSYTLGGTGKLSIHNSMIALASGATGVARSFVLKDSANLDAGTFTFGSGATSIPRTLSMTGGTSTTGNLNLGNLAP